MAYSKTTAVIKIAALKKRLKIIQGGSSAGKTIAILLLLIDLAQCTEGLLISVVSETMPHLKRGAIRDFLSIMESHKYYKDDRWNRTDYFYQFESGSRIEFFSADSPDKVRGPRRDVLFINECNNVPFETYTQLAIRTKGDIYLDYNPVSQFWVHDEIIPKLDHDFLIITYKDNEGLPETIVKELESRKDNKSFWRVYGEGQLGEAEGKIYKNWAIIDEVPHEARLERRGIDFGFTNDPTAIIDVYYYNGGYVLDEIAFLKGLSNKQIVDIIQAQEQKCLCVADSAEPKSIQEISSYGVMITPADKGPDSVVHGIQLVQEASISVTKRSINLIKEYRNYLWMVDKNGKILNEPDHTFSHSMDAVRYALVQLLKTRHKKSDDLVDSSKRFYSQGVLAGTDDRFKIYQGTSL